MAMVKNVSMNLITTYWHKLFKMATRNSAKMSAEQKAILTLLRALLKARVLGYRILLKKDQH